MSVLRIVVLLVATSCSFTLDTVDDAVPPGGRPTCDPGISKPAADTVAAAVLGVAALMKLREEECEGSRCSDEVLPDRMVGEVLLVPAAFAAVAAAYGYIQVARCRGALGRGGSGADMTGGAP